MKRICKLASVILILSLIFSGCANNGLVMGKFKTVELNPVNHQGVVLENGGMASEVGTNNRPRTDVVRTRDFLKIEDFKRVELGDGYHMVFILYSDRDSTTRITSSGWLQDGQDFTFEEFLKNSNFTEYPSGNEPVYFRLVVSANSDAEVSSLPKDALTLTTADGKRETPEMTRGTIDKGTVYAGVNTRLHTKDLLSLEDYKSVSLSADYKAVYHIYNEDGYWLGSLNGWQQGKAESLFTTEQMLDTSKLSNYISGKAPVYFKFQIKYAKVEGGEVLTSNLKNMGLNFVKSDTADNDNLNYPENEKETDFKFENVFEIGAAYNGPWQEGAIADGKLFAINHNGEGVVYSLEGKEKLGTFLLDKRNAINPHANSVAFGSQYYKKGDKYPLMYVSVYNNYENDAERYEGHCLVYRILEDKKGYSSELVQVIKIGFTEDLTLWKSLEGRGDVNPFGNFVVDTDNNELYAYVLRDADKVTRFFKFSVPSLDEGEKNSRYGCNVVTLEPADIKDQFDTEYFTYIQGTGYVSGMIVSSAGLGYGNAGAAQINIIDLKTKKAVATYNPISAGLYNEAEIVAVDRETNKVYYAGSDGQVRYLTFMDKFVDERK